MISISDVTNSNNNNDHKPSTRNHLLARLGTKVTVDMRDHKVRGTFKFLDPTMHWLEVEENTKDGPKVHFINIHAISEIVGVGTDEIVRRRDGGES